MDNFQAGDIVKLGPSFVGIIEAVFTSKEADTVLYEIRWTKNIWQPSSTEIIPHKPFLELASTLELLNNIAQMKKRFLDNEMLLLDRLQEL